MIREPYYSVGVFAEGRTDYDFLLGLIDQLISANAADLLGPRFQSAPSRAIDAPAAKRRESREDRIAAAIEENWDECTLFVIHADSDGDAGRALHERIEPGLARARVGHTDLAAAACVPVRETEAWMLADAQAFSRLFDTPRAPALPEAPESDLDPKRSLEAALTSLGARGKLTNYYADLGKTVNLAELRRLPAFCRFEADLRAAILVVADLAGKIPGPRV